MDLAYRIAAPADAATLARLFEAVFRETFGALYTEADLAAFLRGHDAASWRTQLADAACWVRLAEDEDAAIGFAKLRPVTLPVTPDVPALELAQLYVAAAAQGAGIADRLFDDVLAEARRRGAAALYLSVYTDNARARRFYARRGFVELGPYTFMVGAQADEDVLMRLDVR